VRQDEGQASRFDYALKALVHMICVGVLIDAETVRGIKTCFCTFVATISREEEKGGCATLMPLYHAPHACVTGVGERAYSAARVALERIRGERPDSVPHARALLGYQGSRREPAAESESRTTGMVYG